MPEPNPPPVAEVAARLAKRLEEIECDYALGGAIALACWAEPRGTVDADVSFFLPIKELGKTVAVLHAINAEFSESKVRESLAEHGFCSVQFLGRRLALGHWRRPCANTVNQPWGTWVTQQG